MTKKRKNTARATPPRSNSPPTYEQEVFMLRVNKNELQYLTQLCPEISVHKDIGEPAERYVHECIIRYHADMCILADLVKEACVKGLTTDLQEVNAVLDAWFWDSLVVPAYDSKWTKQKWLTPEGEILGPRLVTVLENFERD